jgi:hypothetical protein
VEVMTEMAVLLQNKIVSHYVHSQFKKLKKNKDVINCKVILNKLAEKLKETYTIVNQTSDELIIKFDKKKNVDDIKNDIKSNIQSLVDKDIDIDFLFRIIKNNNELIIRAKRMV